MVRGAHQSSAFCYSGRFSARQTVSHLSIEKNNLSNISPLQGSSRRDGCGVSDALNWFASC
jgi:hypothetical protein